MTAKAVVLRRALEARVSRVLAKQDRILRKCKPTAHAFHELGEYYLVDLNRNVIVQKHVDLEALARKLGALHAYEVLGR